MKYYLAGAETIYRSYGYLPPPSMSIFCTYFYKNQSTYLLNTAPKRTGFVTIDTGAHSFFNMSGVACTTGTGGEARRKKTPDPDEYFDGYVCWLIDNADKFDYFVELDIQALIGTERVKRWRRRFVDVGLWRKCIPVFHSCDQWSDYEELLATAESRYVGLEGYRDGRLLLPMMRCIRSAYDAGVRVHCFAMTDCAVVNKYPFYSVDASSWTNCVRWGRASTFRNGKITYLSANEKFFRSELGDPEQLHKQRRQRDLAPIKLAFNAKAYADAEAYYTRVWRERGVVWPD